MWTQRFNLTGLEPIAAGQFLSRVNTNQTLRTVRYSPVRDRNRCGHGLRLANVQAVGCAHIRATTGYISATFVQV